jgi:hypothetical protein
METEQIPPIVDAAIEQRARAHTDTVADFGGLDPIAAAATFAGLLAMPHLQANCIRIEALVHLAVANCGGRMTPTEEAVLRNFERLASFLLIRLLRSVHQPL